ncbi:Alpha/Beta hydrolase protein [Fennellomyces sp. T-0311]|nr:Alpha/Beta hydrolase protein [Fennellomyces sp. T-0311]
MSSQVVLDPAYAALCEQAKGLPRVAKGEISIEELRRLSDLHSGQANESSDVIEEAITVAYNDKQIRLTLFRPKGSENEMLPVMIFYHGGGWIIGSTYTHGNPVREICVNSHVAVVFVNYKLAPEAKFPEIHDESFLALQWVLENGKSINVDSSKLAVCGDSSGGNLATSVTLMAKKRGLSNAIKAQILIYPATAPAPYRESFESFKLFGNGEYWMSEEDGKFYDQNYFNDPGSVEFGTPLLVAQDELQDLPPALVINAEADPLRDEGEKYARKLIQAGVPTAAVRVAGTIHGYFHMPMKTPAYKQTIAMITTQLNDVFNR